MTRWPLKLPVSVEYAGGGSRLTSLVSCSSRWEHLMMVRITRTQRASDLVATPSPMPRLRAIHSFVGEAGERASHHRLPCALAVNYRTVVQQRIPNNQTTQQYRTRVNPRESTSTKIEHISAFESVPHLERRQPRKQNAVTSSCLAKWLNASPGEKTEGGTQTGQSTAFGVVHPRLLIRYFFVVQII